jgi:MraW methylase family
MERGGRRPYRLRIAVNYEFSALETFLRHLPACLNPGGRVAVLTFHSGEDRRVKKALAAGCRDGLYAEIAQEVIRPTADERHANSRSAPAKLRWAPIDFKELNMGLFAVRRVPIDVKELRRGAFDGGVVEPQGNEAALLVQRVAEPEGAGLQLRPVRAVKWLRVES